MVVLGIETATSVLSVGLVSDGNIINEMHLDEKYAHAERLPEFVQKVLAESQTNGEALDLIAVSNGPGSFTGLRIGLALAKGLAMGWECPLIAVPTLDGMAIQMSHKKKHGAVLLTARRGEVYQAVFQIKDNNWERLGDVQCIKDEDLGFGLDSKEMMFAGQGSQRLKNIIQDRFPKSVILNHETVKPNGAAIAQLGEIMHIKGERTDLSSVVPFYYKRFQGVA